MKRVFGLFALMLLLVKNTVFCSCANDSLYATPIFPEYGYEIYKFNPDTSFQYFNTGATYFLELGDTANYITCLMGISDIERRQGRYNHSFEILRDIQKNIIRNSDYDGLIDLHIRLGRLYGIYGQDSLALYHHKSALEISKRHTYYKNSTSTYFAIAEQLSNMQNYEEAILYLDSCYLSSKNEKRQIYVDALYAYSYLKKGDYRKAEINIRGLIPLFQANELGFLAKVYAFNAELKAATGERDSAIYYYKLSLITANKLKQHYEIKPMVLEQLAMLYSEKENTKEAFRYLLMHKEISDSLFNLQSAQNKELFEIKNEYGEDITKKEEQILAQKKLIELNNKASMRLKLLLFVMMLSIGIGFFTFRQRFQVRRLVSEKRQNEDVIDEKNKELTANALQLIEKEHSINELLDFVKEHTPEKHKLFNYKTKQNNKRIWDDFHLRFTKTNPKFYEKLLSLHPELTQTDLKHCALVKLNFDSKEMAVILGISLHGVHTARSRIRKKIGLSRDESLGGYLAGIA